MNLMRRRSAPHNEFRLCGSRADVESEGSEIVIRSTFILGIFYVLVPYVVFQFVLRWSGSTACSGIAAVASVPVAIFGYVRLFESVKRRQLSKGA